MQKAKKEERTINFVTYLGEFERCTLCGVTTKIKKDTPIDRRPYYIEGGGQLCRKCYCDVYGSDVK